MTIHTYDPSGGDGTIPRGTAGSVYATTDTTYATPLAITPAGGSPGTVLTSGPGGILPGFTVADHAAVVWRAGNFSATLSASVPTSSLDATVAALVADPESDLSAGLSSTFGRVTVALQDADGGDVSLALRRACVAAEPIGAAVYIPGGAYSAATVCEIGDLDSVRVEAAPDAEITVMFDGTFFRAGPPTWEAIQAATPPAAAGGYWGDRRVVGVADASAYAAGDLVRVVADDKAPCTRATPGDGTDYRIGEYGIVVSTDTDADTITLDRPLEHGYATNPRVGRLPRRTVHWHGGRIGYETGHGTSGGVGGTGWRGTAMQFYGVSDLNVEVEITHAYNSAINLTGCFEAAVSGVGRDLLNNEANLQYGYLVNDASEYTTVSAILAGRNRHGYTSNMPVVAANSTSLHLYGETRGAVISARSDGDTQAGVDTHHGSVRCTFLNPVISGGMTGGGQIVIRGREHRVIAPTLANGKEGMFIYTEAGVTNGNTSVEIVNPDIDVDRYPIVVDTATVTIRGGRLRSRKYGVAVKLSEAALTLRGVIEVRPGGTADIDSRRTIDIVDSAVDARGATVLADLQDIPGSAVNYGVLQFGGSTASSWTGGLIKTINDDYLTCVAYTKAGATGTMSLGVGGGLQIETESKGANPKTTMDITGAGGIGFAGGWTWRHLGGSGGSCYIERTISSDGYALPWYGRDDDAVFVRLFVNTTPRTLGTLPAGSHLGQMMHISATFAGGATLTLKHGYASYKTLLKGGADIVLSTAETGVTLCWNGTGWTSILL